MMSGDFEIGDWRVQPSANRLVRNGEVVRLEPKVMHVLVCLAEHAGDVVTREQLIARVWSDVFVTDDVLHRAVRELRRVFGDRTDAPRYIETIRKRGYRLMLAAAPPAQREGAASLDVAAASSDVPARLLPQLPAETHARVWPLVGLAVLLAGICGAGVVGLALRDEPVTEAHARFVPLVSGPANESDPALAPDGRRIAYVVRDSATDQADIYLADSPGAPAHRLTDDPGDDRMPAWSPDGRRLAFIRFARHDCTIVIRSLDTFHGLHELHGSDEQRVGACGNHEEPRVAWLDAHTLLVAELPADGRPSGRLARLSLTTGLRTPMSDPPAGIMGDHSPAVSPDGRTVAFIRRASGGASDLYTVSRNAGVSRRVTFDEADITGVTWTANGRALVYSSDRAGGYSLWRVPAEGGAPELLAGGAARLKHPVSVAGGERVAYESWNYEINVWQVELAAQAGPELHAAPVIQTSDLWNLYPQVSPDGRTIAYVSTQSGSHELWVANRDGSERRQLTDFGSESRAELGGTAVRPAQWAPDSRHLAFVAQRAGQVDVYTIDARSGALQAITTDAAIEVAPGWSTDGRILYGRRDDRGWNVWARRADGGEATVLIPQAVAAQIAGDAIYFTRADRNGVWRWHGPDRQPDLIAAEVPAGDTVNWQIARDGVYAAAGEGRSVVLRRVPLTGGASTRVAELPQYSWPGFSLTPDGAHVLYARWDRRESNIMAIEVR